MHFINSPDKRRCVRVRQSWFYVIRRNWWPVRLAQCSTRNQLLRRKAISRGATKAPVVFVEDTWVLLFDSFHFPCISQRRVPTPCRYYLRIKGNLHVSANDLTLK
jgi:hypothetical protein